MSFKKLTIKQFLNMVEDKKISSMDLLQEMEKETIRLKNLNIFIENWFEEAKQQAKNNNSLIPIGLKDIFLYKDKIISSASKMLKNFVSPYSSTIVNRLLDHNVVFNGRLNMDEFAMGGSGKTSYYGPTISPWKNSKNEDMCPGGSSSGSSSAVAAGLCLAATGTDTGGSVRLPAAYTGTVGLKPTYGVFSRYGVIDFASSLDCPGLITKTVEDSEFLFSKLVGQDPMDFTSVDYIAQKSSKKVGIFVSDKDDPAIVKQIQQAAQILEKNGYTVQDVKIDLLEYMVPCYYILAPSEAASNLSRYNGIFYGDKDIKIEDLDDIYTKIRSECFGEEVQRRIVIGNFMMFCGNVDGFYNKARKIINKVWKNIKPILDIYDFILMPASHGIAPTMEEIKKPDPVKLYLEDFYTCFANMLGIPGLSIPMGLCEKENMPIGIQLISRPFGENLMFDGAKIIEKEIMFLEKFGGGNI